MKYRKMGEKSDEAASTNAEVFAAEKKHKNYHPTRTEISIQFRIIKFKQKIYQDPKPHRGKGSLAASLA
jgi:hypothetical protein